MDVRHGGILIVVQSRAGVGAQEWGQGVGTRCVGIGDGVV